MGRPGTRLSVAANLKFRTTTPRNRATLCSETARSGPKCMRYPADLPTDKLMTCL